MVNKPIMGHMYFIVVGRDVLSGMYVHETGYRPIDREFGIQCFAPHPGLGGPAVARNFYRNSKDLYATEDEAKRACFIDTLKGVCN